MKDLKRLSTTTLLWLSGVFATGMASQQEVEKKNGEALNHRTLLPAAAVSGRQWGAWGHSVPHSGPFLFN